MTDGTAVRLMFRKREGWGFVLAFPATEESKETFREVISEKRMNHKAEQRNLRMNGGRGRAQRFSKPTSQLSLQIVSSNLSSENINLSHF